MEKASGKDRRYLPDLLSLCSEHVMRSIENMLGISVSGNSINNLCYLNDAVLIAENHRELHKTIYTGISR